MAKVTAEQPKHSIMELEGLGKEIWAGVDPKKYRDELWGDTRARMRFEAACAAMQSVIDYHLRDVNPSTWSREEAALSAVRYADALLAELDKKDNPHAALLREAADGINKLLDGSVNGIILGVFDFSYANDLIARLRAAAGEEGK